MFPLGVTLLPGLALPLRLFEERYLRMYADIIDDEREFGVVLIERGAESRDDSPTFAIGCVARILGSGLHEDGTIALVALGMRRLQVIEWRPSDPYPRARVAELEDDPLTETGMKSLESAADQLPGLLTMAAELNPELGSGVPQLSEDPVHAIYQLAQLSGLQTLDLQKVLEAETSDERAALVTELMADVSELMRLQLEIG